MYRKYSLVKTDDQKVGIVIGRVKDTRWVKFIDQLGYVQGYDRIPVEKLTQETGKEWRSARLNHFRLLRAMMQEYPKLNLI